MLLASSFTRGGLPLGCFTFLCIFRNFQNTVLKKHPPSGCFCSHQPIKTCLEWTIVATENVCGILFRVNKKSNRQRLLFCLSQRKIQIFLCLYCLLGTCFYHAANDLNFCLITIVSQFENGCIGKFLTLTSL